MIKSNIINESKWEIPSFQSLLEGAKLLIRPDDLCVETCCDSMRLQDVPGKIRLPLEACGRFSFDPLLLEFCLLRPRFDDGRPDAPMAASHVLSLWDDAKGSVLRAWTTALIELVAGENASFTPLVAQKQLYNSAVCIRVENGAQESRGEEDTSGGPRPYSACSFGFQYKPSELNDMLILSERFVEAFKSRLNRLPLDAHLKAIYQEFIVLIIPLLRPDSDPVLSETRSLAGKCETLQPAGAVFLALRSTKGRLADRQNLITEDLPGLITELQASLRKVALDEAYSFARVVSDRMAHSNRLGHILRTVVSMTSWEVSYQRLCELLRQGEPAPIRDVRQAANSLSLFMAAQGLGELLRLLGIIERNDVAGDRKLVGWVNRDLLDAWNRGAHTVIAPLFEQLILNVTKTLCRGQSDLNWLRLEFYQDNNLTPSSKWQAKDDTALEVLDLKSLACPPFHKNSAAVYLMLPALIEPIRNALVYLKQHNEYALNRPLKFRLKCQLPDNVYLEIGNRIEPGDNMETLPEGIRLTGTVMKRIKFATFETSRQVREPDGTETFWLPMRLHPNELAEEIWSRTQ